MDSKSSSASTIRQLGLAQTAFNKNQERLSTGSRINRASDDAAGLAIAATLDAVVAELHTADRNVSYGASFAEMADSTMGQLSDIMGRMGELATAASNGVYSDEQRASMNNEYQALAQEAQRITETTTFNGIQVFSEEGVTIQAGTDSSANSQLQVGGTDVSNVIQQLAAQNLSTQDGARTAIDTVNSQIQNLSGQRGEVGASLQRLDVASANNHATAEALQTSSARIRDADIAEEAAQATANKIKMQAGTAMAAQNNVNQQMVLRLLS